MGATIWLEIQGVSTEETHNDLSKLHRLSEEIDEIAEKNGLPKLSGFYDWSVMAEEADGILELLDGRDDEDEDDDDTGGSPAEANESDDEDSPAGEWFEAGPLLKTLSMIRDHVRSPSNTLVMPTSDRDRPRYLREFIEELDFAIPFVEAAARQRQPVRLLVVP